MKKQLVLSFLGAKGEERYRISKATQIRLMNAGCRWISGGQRHLSVSPAYILVDVPSGELTWDGSPLTINHLKETELYIYDVTNANDMAQFWNWLERELVEERVIEGVKVHVTKNKVTVDDSELIARVHAQAVAIQKERWG